MWVCYLIILRKVVIFPCLMTLRTLYTYPEFLYDSFSLVCVFSCTIYYWKCTLRSLPFYLDVLFPSSSNRLSLPNQYFPYFFENPRLFFIRCSTNTVINVPTCVNCFEYLICECPPKTMYISYGVISNKIFYVLVSFCDGHNFGKDTVFGLSPTKIPFFLSV